MKALKLISQGKVCDIFRNDDVPGKLFFRRTDRFSIGDKVFPGQMVYKGLILNQMALNWMNMLKEQEIVSNHLFATTAEKLLRYGADLSDAGCIVAADECIAVPLECIVRGYYIPESHSWDPYLIDGTLYGNVLPKGLIASQALPTPIYTPSTKAAVGQHDENISFEQSVSVIKKFLAEHPEIPSGKSIDLEATELATKLKELSLKIYTFLHNYAYEHSIIIADTKLEFGIRVDEDAQAYEVVLIDEVGTPDTSRYWDLKTYVVGQPNPSMDKQYLRRYVYQTLGWKSDEEPPVLPVDVMHNASRIYCNIYERLFGVTVEVLSENVTWEWKKQLDKITEEESLSKADEAYTAYLKSQQEEV